MPYGKSRYGISYYGQLELPILDKVGGLLRYNEPGPNYSIVRADHPDYTLTITRTDHQLQMRVDRDGSHEVGIGVTRAEGYETTVALSRAGNAVQIQLHRSFEVEFDALLLVRSWDDIIER